MFYEKTKAMVSSNQLKAKWLEFSLESFCLSPYKKLYLARTALIILSYPLLVEPEYSNILVLISSQLVTCPSQYQVLTK